MRKLKTPIKQLYQFATRYLRPRDRKSRQYNLVLSNSHYTAQLAKKLYGLDAQVSYPSIDKAFLDEPVCESPKDYLVFVGRVQKYVREIDTIIHACNQTKTNLVVIGNGPDMDYAYSIAGHTILFVGHISDINEKIDLMKNARGMINLAKESFGIATAESLCLGVPVLGYTKGATPELVDTNCGVLIHDKSIEGTITGLQDFLKKDFDRKYISRKAREKFFEKA